MLTEIPTTKPETPLLDTINSPADLKKLARSQLKELAHELRLFLLYSVGQTGGHFGAGLGVVELTIALHYVFDTPEDRLVWDVGASGLPPQDSDRTSRTYADHAPGRRPDRLSQPR